MHDDSASVELRTTCIYNVTDNYQQIITKLSLVSCYLYS